MDCRAIPTAHDANASGWGGNLGVSYYLPIRWNLWAFAGARYEYRKVEFLNPDIDIKYKNDRGSLSLGVSYGF